MKRMIDNTYLQSVGRCIQGDADSIDDIITFVRFIGEVIISSKIIYTADKSGPVYSISKNCQSEINEYATDGILHYLDKGKINKEKVFREVRSDIENEIEFLNSKEPDKKRRFEPDFERSNNPDLIFHELLSYSKKKDVKSVKKKVPSHSSQILQILNDQVISKVRDFGESHGKWTEQQTLSLISSIRMLIYEKMSEFLDVYYLPATGRAKLHSVVNISEDNHISSVIEKDRKKEVSSDESLLASIVWSLVAVQEGKPKEILAKAFEVRKETKEVRDLFKPRVCVDALCLEDSGKRDRLQKVFDALMGEIDQPSLTDSLQPVLVLPGLPTISVDLTKLQEWWSYKKNSQKMKIVARLILKAKSYSEDTILDRLIYHSGLTKHE